MSKPFKATQCKCSFILFQLLVFLPVLSAALRSDALLSTAKTQAQEILKPYAEKYARTHSEFNTKTEQIVSDHDVIKKEHESIIKDYTKLYGELEEFQKKAIANSHGLRSAILGWNLVTNYMLNSSRPKELLEDAKRYIDDVINRIQPDDELVSSLALGVKGNILYYDQNFAAAVDALRMAIAKDNENFRARFNLACCACKLADEIEAKGVAATEILTLENEALSSLLFVVMRQPWRMAQARSESQTGDMKRIRDHPQFKLLISA